MYCNCASSENSQRLQMMETSLFEVSLNSKLSILKVDRQKVRTEFAKSLLFQMKVFSAVDISSQLRFAIQHTKASKNATIKIVKAIIN